MTLKNLYYPSMNQAMRFVQLPVFFSVTIWASIEESWVVADCNLGCSDGRESSKVAFQSYWCTPLA